MERALLAAGQFAHLSAEDISHELDIAEAGWEEYRSGKSVGADYQIGFPCQQNPFQRYWSEERDFLPEFPIHLAESRGITCAVCLKVGRFQARSCSNFSRFVCPRWLDALDGDIRLHPICTTCHGFVVRYAYEKGILHRHGKEQYVRRGHPILMSDDECAEALCFMMANSRFRSYLAKTAQPHLYLDPRAA